ncbi:MAG: PilZ domain-containing protein [Thiotrichales bacterium]|nr:PilZ domain-containing protein [Thiotrichales bacterium]
MSQAGQRSYFRIDVNLRCSYRIIPAERLAQTPFPESTKASYIESQMMQDFSDLDQQIQQAIGAIQERSELLANALNALNRKLNFLIETMDTTQIAKAIPVRSVNLSGNGIALDIAGPIHPEDKVDLLMQPLENEAPILVRASVITTQPAQDGQRQRVALQYDNLSEEDRRKLIFFIQAKEIELARGNKS